MRPDVIALITARGGSKSIPGKNIRLLAGKPLIQWSIDAARGVSGIRRVIVSTDDAEIARIAAAGGAEIPFIRPAELAQDASSHIGVMLHALDWLECEQGDRPDYVLLLQPTCPLRTADDLQAVIALAAEHPAADAVVSVSAAENHPFLTKTISDQGYLADFMTTEIRYLRRQDLPPAYALNGALYLNRRASLLEHQTFLPARTLPYVMPPERSLDIDTPWDFHLAELVLNYPFVDNS